MMAPNDGSQKQSETPDALALKVLARDRTMTCHSEAYRLAQAYADTRDGLACRIGDLILNELEVLLRTPSAYDAR